jgi:serine/threonine protein kinase
MLRETASLKSLADTGAKVPRVLETNTDDFENLDNELYIVMEFIKGHKLSDELRAHGRFSLEKAVACTLDLCRTVEIAHNEDVLHRDLKPENIIVRDFDSADLVVVDFGLSFNDEDGDESITRTGETMRNRLIALPETNTPTGNRRDPRSDLTALCAVFYYCLTGQEPGQLRDERDRAAHRREGCGIAQYLLGDPRCLQVESFLDCGFAQDINNRFQTLAELRARLTSLLTPGQVVGADLLATDSRWGVALRQIDRKTRVREFRNLITPLNTQLYQHLAANLAGKLKTFTPSIGGGLGMNKDLPEGFDLVSQGFTLTLTIADHPHSRPIQFIFAAKGVQCAFLRSVVEGMEGKPPTKCRDWEILLWFDPMQQPEATVFKKLIDASVSQVMDELGQIVTHAANA